MHNNKIAVFMITYNHAPFIAQAIQSVLDQKGDFILRLFIGEDCSTDDTGLICKKYRDRFPELIDLVNNPTNIGPILNARNVYLRCLEFGDYIAILEGDDYWTDPFKLQKQLDCLQANPDCNLVYHDVKVVNRQGYGEDLFAMKNRAPFIELKDLLLGEHPKICSVLFKVSPYIKKRILRLFSTGYYLQDTQLLIIITERGKGVFMPVTMAAYRLHEGGIWSPLSQPQKSLQVLSGFTGFIKMFPESLNVLWYGLANATRQFYSICVLFYRRRISLRNYIVSVCQFVKILYYSIVRSVQIVVAERRK